MKNDLLEEHVRYGEARFRDKNIVRPFVNRIYQDLAELEQAMKPKTCLTCLCCNKEYQLMSDLPQYELKCGIFKTIFVNDSKQCCSKHTHQRITHEGYFS